MTECDREKMDYDREKMECDGLKNKSDGKRRIGDTLSGFFATKIFQKYRQTGTLLVLLISLFAALFVIVSLLRLTQDIYVTTRTQATLLPPVAP